MKTIARILWLISGFLLLVAGIFVLFNPTATIISLSFLLGLIMLFSGIFSLFVYFVARYDLFGMGWVLADGIITVILALFLLFNDYIAATALPFIFGMWILFSGIERIVNSIEIRDTGISGWGWLMAIGIVSIVVGVLSFINPLIGAIAISTFLGIFLILQGIAVIITWVYSWLLKNYM